MLYIYDMEKKYTHQDLIDFGNYLLSPYRIENLLSVAESEGFDKDELFEQGLNCVIDVDIDCWNLIKQ